MQPAYDGMQDAGCSRAQQAACVLQASCMQGACISSVNLALNDVATSGRPFITLCNVIRLSPFLADILTS